ncbi:hypothetical protein LOTGIDRAFT_170761 [Lottia gigantea]|uniref:Uncharacterized protein n=1 Tax=Lottia gigantea TaxID=225164 RepID=V4BAJ8_LOTGI|nr:hypothetical protein LOTGIDRAFT_170761 [Lottia gigantea]ESP04516.1 hypothetical protein LOTGIDRAFT_170761 [Lottia gigantea]
MTKVELRYFISLLVAVEKSVKTPVTQMSVSVTIVWIYGQELLLNMQIGFPLTEDVRKAEKAFKYGDINRQVMSPLHHKRYHSVRWKGEAHYEGIQECAESE